MLSQILVFLKARIFYLQIIALLFMKYSPLRWYQLLKVYLKKMHTKHYFKMRKHINWCKTSFDGYMIFHHDINIIFHV